MPILKRLAGICMCRGSSWPPVIHLVVLLSLALLACSWSVADCLRTAPGDPSHIELDVKGQDMDELGKHLLSRLGIEAHIKRLMQLNIEEYSDLEEPPALAEANHGPIVFTRPKRRRRHPGFNP